MLLVIRRACTRGLLINWRGALRAERFQCCLAQESLGDQALLIVCSHAIQRRKPVLSHVRDFFRSATLMFHILQDFFIRRSRRVNKVEEDVDFFGGPTDGLTDPFRDNVRAVVEPPRLESSGASLSRRGCDRRGAGVDVGGVGGRCWSSSSCVLLTGIRLIMVGCSRDPRVNSIVHLVCRFGIIVEVSVASAALSGGRRLMLAAGGAHKYWNRVRKRKPSTLSRCRGAIRREARFRDIGQSALTTRDEVQSPIFVHAEEHREGHLTFVE